MGAFTPAMFVTAIVIGLGVTPADAAAASRDSVRYASLKCPLLTGPGATAALFTGHTEDGPSASSQVWQPGDDPNSDSPWLVAWDGEPTLQATSLHVTLQLTDVEGQETREGLLQAVLSPAGRSSITSQRWRHGNSWERVTTTTTPATVSGTYDIVGVGSFDLSTCAADLVQVKSSRTRPAAFALNYVETMIGCAMATPDEDITVSASSYNRVGHVEAHLEAWVRPNGGGEFEGYMGSSTGLLTRRALTGSIPMVSDFEGEPTPVGTAVVSARLTRATVQLFRFNEGRSSGLTKVETLRVEGTFTLPDGRRITLDSCAATRTTVTYRELPSRTARTT